MMSADVRDSALDARQVRAVEMLAEGQKNAEVARALGVDARTVRRWGELPDFAALLSEVQAVGLESARVRIGALLESALDAIQDVLTDQGAPAAARLRAAELVLSRVSLERPTTMPAPSEVNDALEFMRWREEKQKAHTADLRDALGEIKRQHPDLVAEVLGSGALAHNGGDA